MDIYFKKKNLSEAEVIILHLAENSNTAEAFPNNGSYDGI